MIIKQLLAFINGWNIAYAFIGLVIAFYYGRGLYRAAQKEYIYIDFKISAFELDFLKAFSLYFIWGLVQQIIIVTAVAFVPNFGTYGYLVHFAIALVLFSVVCHLPNFELMKNTFFLGLFVYFGYYVCHFESIIWMGVIHGFGGTILKQLGVDMRVYRF